MSQLERIALIMDDQHAQLVARALEELGVTHVLRSYHDSAYDGLFQSQTAWGHVEAPPADRELVETVVRDLGSPPLSGHDAGAGIDCL